MQTPSGKMHRDMQRVVGKTMHETFGGMLDWPLNTAAKDSTETIDRPVRSHVLLREGRDVSVDVVLDFDHRLLSLAGDALYPETLRGTPEMYSDMAGAITNIIAGSIKAYLNGGGHDLRMVDAPPATPDAPPPVIDVPFRYNSGTGATPLGVVVHVRLKDFPV